MRFYKQIFFADRFYQIGSGVIFLFIISYFFPVLFGFIGILSLLFGLLLLLDIVLLFSIKKELYADRQTPERLSNGEKNEISLYTVNKGIQTLDLELIDEAPIAFQLRDLKFKFQLKPSEEENITYKITPKERGEYHFGDLIIFVKSKLGLVRRKLKQNCTVQSVKVYPSFNKLKQYELMAFNTGHMDGGIKKVRRVGQQKEFDQIKEYVAGDDFRTINWMATARSQQLMVNHYQDEKAQQVYAVLDMSRNMKLPFDGMTLLDYSINASLILLHIAQVKQDLIGVSAFDYNTSNFLKASRNSGQMKNVLEQLYNLNPSFKETDFAKVTTLLRRQIKQRSLLLFFTNITHKESLKRKLPYLKRLTQKHLLVVVLFEDTEIKEALKKQAQSMDDIYRKALQEENILERRFIAKELQQNGIHTILTTPDKLNVDTINKYLELKARGLI
ncbi:DUF58 domain-containing protein [Flammeovirga sp. EKP202]|uniref:DUF58 domain-containing protein n=1 Tax=Flammeovirga sp. EKP202 TaxID=2770592 RepID=UPI00165F4832|nr:DUF58 domain-containing protein [Flammeovirga sp. EKP202]MBD0402973.1 DUF58 domain-containing protein [Flammeovirga sp. EKP202]